MKPLRYSVFLQYVLLSTILSFCFLTQEFTVTTDGGYAKLYGFPFPYLSETWAWTGHHSVFLANMVIDFALYFCFWVLIFFPLEKRSLIPQTTFPPKLILGGFLFWMSFQMILGENSYQWEQDHEFIIDRQTIHFGFYYTRH